MNNLNFGKVAPKPADAAPKEPQIIMKHILNAPVAEHAAAAAPPPMSGEVIPPAPSVNTDAEEVRYFFCPSLPSMQMHIPSGRNMGIAKTIKFESGAYATADQQEIKFIELTMKTSGQLIHNATREQFERTISANRGIASTMQSSARQFANSDAVRGVRNHNYMEQRAAAAGITPTEEQRKQYAEATRAGDHGGSFGDAPPAPRK